MRITEFATQLFTKFTPVSTEAVANLNVELSNYYNNILNNMNLKEEKNEKLTKQAEAIKTELGSLEKGTPEYDKKVFEFTELHDQFEKPSVIERVVSFLDKPLVRTLLLISFAFIARYLAKKLTSPVTPKEEEEQEEVEQQNYAFKPQQHYGYPPMYYGQQPPFYGGYPQPQYQVNHK